MARAHLYKPIVTTAGDIVAPVNVRVLNPGGVEMLTNEDGSPATVYSGPTGEAAYVNGPPTYMTFADGIVDFYLNRPRRVRLGVTPSGQNEFFLDDVDVMSDSVVSVPLPMQVTNTPTVIGQVLIADGSTASHWGTPGEIDDAIAAASAYSETYNDLEAGVSTMPRSIASFNNAVSTVSQSLRLTYFTANKGFTANSLRLFSGSIAAGATPTLVRAGIYSIAANGDGTLLGAIGNTPTLFAAATTLYTAALATPVPIVQGQRYALGVLVVSAAALPNLPGLPLFSAGTYGGPEAAMSPRISGAVNGQADLPASFLAGTVQPVPGRFYAALVP